MKRPNLAALVLEIQTGMRLLDWRIDARYVPDLADADGNPVYGLCNRLLDNKTAQILIRDPASPLPAGVAAKSPLEIVLHEMVHVRLANLAADPSEVNEEQATWPLAELLFRKWGTAEAAALMRAMAAPASSKGQIIARAMAARAEVARATGGRCMNPKEYARALAAALAMEGEEQKKALAALAAKMEADGEEKPPESEKKKEAQPQRTAETEPEKKPAEPRAQVITLADVERIAERRASAASAEVLERANLITANRGRMTDGQATLFSRMPLADVKAQIAALPPATADEKKKGGGEQRAARVRVAPVGGPAEDTTPEQQILVGRVDQLMGLSTTKVAPIEVDQRGMRLSHLADVSVADYVREQAQKAQGVS